MNSLMTTYARKDITFTKGDGVWLWDQNSTKYLDALSGIAVCGLGHSHPEITQAISQQAGTLIHTSNIYRIDQQEKLGAKLCNISQMERVFFSNSGAEANEAAIKLARLYGHSKNIDNPCVIVFDNSFHGRTMATLTATGNRKAHAGFEPLVSGFIRAPFNDIEMVKQICASNNNVCAILVEPIQGEGGIQVPEENYLNALRQICDKHDLLLMLDEVQTGNGRTGKWFAFQHQQIIPDVITTAKGLGNGMPIGACLATGKASQLFTPGAHGSTFGGNPLVCATALQVLKTIDEDALLANARNMGELIVTQLKTKLSNESLIKDIRGKGLMIGIELKQECAEIVDIALEKNLLINVTAGNVIRILPPLIVNEDQVNLIANTLCECIAAFKSNH